MITRNNVSVPKYFGRDCTFCQIFLPHMFLENDGAFPLYISEICNIFPDKLSLQKECTTHLLNLSIQVISMRCLELSIGHQRNRLHG